MGYLPIVAAALGAVALGGYLWLRAPAAPRGAKLQQIESDFEAHRDQLAAEVLRAAAATGKPRGLRWKSCELSGPPLLAFDPQSKRVFALAGATISFEAIEGGAMEDVEAVGNLRSASAVFIHRGGQWTTDGRVIFNLEPKEALHRFGTALEPLTVPA